MPYPPRDAGLLHSPFLLQDTLLHSQHPPYPQNVKTRPAGSPLWACATDFLLDHDHVETLSPAESVASRSSTSTSSDGAVAWLIDEFFATRSRVVRLFDCHPSPALALVAVFLQGDHHQRYPRPHSLWALTTGTPPDAAADPRSDLRQDASVWAVFETHSEAAALLSLPSISFAAAPALERDFKALHPSLRRIHLPPADHAALRTAPPKPASFPASIPVLPDRFSDRVAFSSPSFPFTTSTAGLQDPLLLLQRMTTRDATPLQLLGVNSSASANTAYTLSSNPPNPRASFRSGDWICAISACAAHNFGRNVACRNCGSPRANGPAQGSQPPQYEFPQLSPISPRFAAAMAPAAPVRIDASRLQHAAPQRAYSLPLGVPSGRAPSPPPAPPPPPAYPLLTPSGRALSVGGHVQNVSTDPLSPCIMYWPDNEPLPAQGQIRPASFAVSYPPIINTGNKGAAEKQPGDWICGTCHYLNWRRRKVCQTCFPYAEGNGDSISAAVQAERIALLENVLAAEMQEQARKNATASHVQQTPTWASASVPHSPRPGAPLASSAASFALPRGPPRADASPLFSSAPGTSWLRTPPSPPPPPISAPTPGAPLLPAFLQDIVQSPSLSPATSVSSALTELSLEDRRSAGAVPRAAGAGALKLDALGFRGDSIWRLGGDEGTFLGSRGGAGAGVYTSSSASSPGAAGRREL